MYISLIHKMTESKKFKLNFILQTQVIQNESKHQVVLYVVIKIQIQHLKNNKIKTMKNEKQSRSTHQHTQSHDSKNPQSHSVRKAAAKLKQKQAQLEIIKKRFQVLKGQQQYNRYRTMDQQKRINNHNTIHQSLKKDRLSFEKQLIYNREQELKELKQKHDRLQQQMKDNSKEVFEDLYASRVNQRNKLKGQSKANEQKIDKNRKQLVDWNSKRKDNILSEERSRKILINEFKNNHAKESFGNRSMEASRMTELTQKKDRQLQKLLVYEQQMLKKASQSIAMNQKIKSQFGKVFVEVKEKNYVRFPSISRQSGSYKSNQSNLSRNLSIYEI